MNERQVETLIDNQLKKLDWQDSDIYRQEAKTDEQKKRLGRLRPDYVLYKTGTTETIAIIEAKKPHENLEKAINQGVTYAETLDAPIVFATDGIFTKSYHVKAKKPLYLNKEEIDDLIQCSLALNYIDSNEYFTLDENLIKSREELTNIFKDLNNSFRDAGVRNGMPRIELFCNMLFLKIIDELADQENSLIKQIPSWCRWNKIREKKGEELFTFINGDAFNHFKTAYDGEVLSPITGLLKYNILNDVVDKLDNLHLSSTDTDIKGDAFEYFLRNYGGADTDFGEYFTPRHIVKALVKILNPQFGESVYDPFCGTGGMLINSFKHIHKRMTINDENEEYLKKKTIFGGELTDMYRVAKMNMILTGDGHSNIKRQDSYEQKQTGKHDVVITNMPFGKRMKTEYAGQYGYSTKSAEITGVLHCLDALSDTSTARAGILVPEGILFDGNKVYTSLRQQLVEKHSLENIISLPSGVFGKNTGVKSNILIVKKKPNKQKKHVWYFNVKNDGLSLDAKRQKVQGHNDIDTISSEKNLSIEDKDRLEKLGFSILYKDVIKENKYNLLAKQYKEQILTHSHHPICSLKQLEDQGKIEFLRGNGLSKKDLIQGGKYKCILYGELYTTYHSYSINSIISRTDKKGKILSKKGDILIPATTTADAIGIAVARCVKEENIIIGSDINIIRIIDDAILPEYLSIAFNYPLKKELAKYAKGANILHLSNNDIKNIQLVLPTIEEQHQIVNELDGYQNIIDASKKIVDSYQPYFEVDEGWELKRLGEICDVRDGTHDSPKYQTEGYPLITSRHVLNGRIDFENTNLISKNDLDKINKRSLVDDGDIIMPMIGSIGNPIIVQKNREFAIKNVALIKFKKDSIIDRKFAKYFLQNKTEEFNRVALGSTQKFISLGFIRDTKIPLPPIKIQQEIVEKLEKERLMIEHQKEFIKYFEEKIKDRLNSLWNISDNVKDNQALTVR